MALIGQIYPICQWLRGIAIWHLGFPISYANGHTSTISAFNTNYSKILDYLRWLLLHLLSSNRFIPPLSLAGGPLPFNPADTFAWENSLHSASIIPCSTSHYTSFYTPRFSSFQVRKTILNNVATISVRQSKKQSSRGNGADVMSTSSHAPPPPRQICPKIRIDPAMKEI